MDASRFDALLRTLSTMPSRRGIVRAVAGFALTAPLFVQAGFDESEAKKKHKKKKHKKKKRAVAATCSDNLQNGDETDVDCGGSCPRCGNNKSCDSRDDCASAFCVNGACGSCNGSSQCGSDSYGNCACEQIADGSSACNSIAEIVSQPATCEECAPDLNCLDPGGANVFCVKPCGAA